MPGVMIHAHMVSQIISAVEDNRSLLTWLSEWQEILVIWGCSLVLGSCFCCFKLPYRGVVLAIAILLIPGVGYVVFLEGLWLPIVPSMLSAIATVGTLIFRTKIRRIKFSTLKSVFGVT